MSELPSNEDLYRISEQVNDVIPETVVDEGAYKEYVALVALMETDPSRYFQTSDESLRLNLATAAHILKKQTYHLPASEQAQILEEAKKWSSLSGKMGILKRKAYGGMRHGEHYLGVLQSKQAEIIGYFGKMYKVPEVHKIIVQDWGYDLNIQTLYKFHKKNEAKIYELQEAYKQSHGDIRLAYKRSRLEEYTSMYQNRKAIYEKDKTLQDEKQLQSLLENIRKEVDGDMVITANHTVSGKVSMQIEQTINLQIQNNYLKNINITQLIINRFAGKMDFDPNYVVSRLVNSHYARYTGFKPQEMGQDEDIPYLSNIIYDMDQVKMRAEQLEREDIEARKLPVIEEGDKKMDLKERIRQKLIVQQNQLKQSVIAIEVTK